jgi:hypothetical protein
MGQPRHSRRSTSSYSCLISGRMHSLTAEFAPQAEAAHRKCQAMPLVTDSSATTAAGTIFVLIGRTDLAAGLDIHGAPPLRLPPRQDLKSSQCCINVFVNYISPRTNLHGIDPNTEIPGHGLSPILCSEHCIPVGHCRRHGPRRLRYNGCS